jgi:DNA-binding NarL/FixJ family response regulator
MGAALALIIVSSGRTRDSWHALLRATSLLESVVHADNGPQGLQMVAQHPVDWVLVDSALGEEAWQTVKELQREWPRVRCLVLVHRGDQERRARALGAQGIVPGNCSLEQLEAAMQALQADEQL